MHMKIRIKSLEELAENFDIDIDLHPPVAYYSNDVKDCKWYRCGDASYPIFILGKIFETVHEFDSDVVINVDNNIYGITFGHYDIIDDYKLPKELFEL
jgi:hypothetical protein